MNLFRIIPKRTNKRKYGDNPYREALTVLLFVFLLPYVISCLWGHIGEESEVLFGQMEKETGWIDEGYEVRLLGKWGTKRMSMQEYLIRRLEIIMPEGDESGVEYGTETLKAQAVLLRTELWGFFLANGEGAQDNFIILQDDALIYRGEDIDTEEEALYREAVCGTDGIYLAYEGKPVKAAYFPISNGHTRNAGEVLQNDCYPYLVSVECRQDILAKGYQSRVTVSGEEYCRMVCELLDIDATEDEVWEHLELTYDSAGYVTQAGCNGKLCSGESFRSAFGLASADFYAEWQEESVTFHVKGVGHGLGMSQYGANEKAASGESFDEILADYFFQAELVKIE